MRVLSFSCSVLLFTSLFVVQQQSVEAKPFLFKYFVPQEPARTDSSSSSSSSSGSTGIDFSSILKTKLNILANLLRTGISAGFRFGFNKFFPSNEVASTASSLTSIATTSPQAEFETESTTTSSFKSTNPATTTTTTAESSQNDKLTGSDILSKPINNEGNTHAPDVEANGGEVTTQKNNSDNFNPQVSIKNQQNGAFSYPVNNETTSKVITVKIESNENDITTPKTTAGYDYDNINSNNNYGNSNQQMSENEISNEIMMINNQYLPLL